MDKYNPYNTNSYKISNSITIVHKSLCILQVLKSISSFITQKKKKPKHRDTYIMAKRLKEETVLTRSMPNILEGCHYQLKLGGWPRNIGLGEHTGSSHQSHRNKVRFGNPSASSQKWVNTRDFGGSNKKEGSARDFKSHPKGGLGAIWRPFGVIQFRGK